VDEQKSEAIQPLETLFNINNSFTVFVWLPIFQPLGPKGGGHGPNGPMVNTLVIIIWMFLKFKMACFGPSPLAFFDRNVKH